MKKSQYTKACRTWDQILKHDHRTCMAKCLLFLCALLLSTVLQKLTLLKKNPTDDRRLMKTLSK